MVSDTLVFLCDGKNPPKSVFIEDPLVKDVIARMAERSETGMKKYGVTMERPDVTTVEWLRHAQEEALDLAVYLERCIRDLSK